MKRPDDVQAWVERQEALPRDKMFNLIEFDLLDYIKELEAERDALRKHLSAIAVVEGTPEYIGPDILEINFTVYDEKEDNDGDQTK